MMIGASDYREQRSQTYDFIRNTCCRLETNGRKEVSERIRSCFDASGIKILMVEEENNPVLGEHSVVGLLRLFESFLRLDPCEPQPTSRRGSYIPASDRFTHRPILW